MDRAREKEREKKRRRYCRADYGYYRCLLSPVTYTVDDLDGGMEE